MKTFNFKTRNAQGKVITGSLDAETENEAVAELRRRGLTIVSLSAGRGSGGKSTVSKLKAGPSGGRTTSGKVKPEDLVVFTRQLATMVSAGIPLTEGLEVLEEQTSNKYFKMVLSEVIGDVRGGKDLSQSLARHPKVFKSIYVNMVSSGEASGQLDITLERLAQYQESTEELKGEIKSAMTYPVISLVMITGITLFLLVFIIPKFEEMFTAMRVELPWVTSTLLSTSKFMQSNLTIMALAAIAVTVGIVMYFKSPKGAITRDWLMIKIPVFGPLFAKVAISRFARTFSTLIQSGVPILGALEIVEKTAGNVLFANAIHEASDSVRKGETLGEPMSRTGLFPPMVTRMISIGERSGALESLLEKIADFYDQEVSVAVRSLTAMIEPIMIAVMGVIVGGMVMAIFLPIFKLIGGMAGGA